MRTLISIAILLGAGANAVAAEAVLDSARRCASVRDSLERLVCYDALFATQPVSQSVLPPAQPAPALPPVPPAGAGAVVGPPAAPTPPASATVFGEEMVKRTVEERVDAAGPKTLTATIQALRETRPDVFRMTLDNGQVWQQMDKDGLFHVVVGDTVQIDRGALGGYRMARTSKGRSGWVRVNRIQ